MRVDSLSLSQTIAKAVSNFIALDRTEKYAFSKAAALLPLVLVWLRIRGFQRTQALLRAIAAANACALRVEPNDERSILSVARGVDVAARYGGLGRVSCLTKSLILWCLLRNSGKCDIQIGVRMAEGTFKAHAWVLLDGTVLNDRQDIASEYVPVHRC